MRSLSPLALVVLALPLHAQTLVKDIHPGPDDSGAEFLEGAAVIGGVLYFYADDGTHGRELWRTDGTEAGTALVADINPGPEDSEPSGFIALGDFVYFVADDGTHGRELWRTDGTDAGTALVKDIHPGARPDGTPNSARIGDLVAFGEALYFGADDGVNGDELWRSDGTEAGTVLVKDLFPGSRSDGAPNAGDPSHLYPYGGALFFNGCSADGCELWKTDGTADGTVLVKDIDPAASGNPLLFVELDGLLYFRAETRAHGSELWRSDGTAAGTALFEDLYPGEAPSGLPNESVPRFLTVADGALFFFARTSLGDALWRSDGTPDGTEPIGPFWDEGFAPFAGSPLDALGGHLYLSYRDATHGGELWRTDGTADGTGLFVDLFPGEDDGGAPNNSFPGKPLVVGDRLYFAARDGAGRELWRTDGTAAGTVRLTDINPGEANGIRGNDAEFHLVGDRIVFAATDGVHGNELWSLGVGATSSASGPAAAPLALTVAPNPARRASAVTVALAAPDRVVVEVFDVLGRRVAVLHEGPLAAGAHRLALPAPLGSGVRIVRARTASGAQATAPLTVTR
jgi:ELWxxDGT repeat protein